ncbi:MAG: MoaD/ThiS family protein [Rhodospirillales bacterium]|nr:MoaD/ThiS family protein [Rhodospirillales bacterium]
MPITLKCFATLTDHQPPGDGAVEITEGETVGDIVDRLGIPREIVALVFVNNLRCTLDAEVHDGDMVGLFPMVGGG